MSEYQNFERCIVCRTKILWDEYQKNKHEDSLEITLATNILTALLARFDGMKEEYGVEPPYADLQRRMPKHQFFDCKNLIVKPQISSKTYIHRMRNGTAHIHISHENQNGKIDRICIRSKKQGDDGYEYVFQAKEFCDFVDVLLDVMLDAIPAEEICAGCKYGEK